MSEKLYRVKLNSKGMPNFSTAVEVADRPSGEDCEFCQNHEQGDTLYEPSDWDGGVGFDYIRNIKYCPLCGARMKGADDD